MEFKVIEETRNYYIEKFGKPTETKMGSFTYKFVNGFLDSFNEFINKMLTIIERTGVGVSEKLMENICAYCKLTEPENLDRISNKLNSIILSMDKKVNFTRSKFVNLINDLSTAVEDPKFNPSVISSYFNYYLNVKFMGNEKLSYRNYDRLGNPFRGRNNGLNN